MPLPLIVALVLAFGLDSSSSPGPLSHPELAWRLGFIGSVIAALALASLGLGRWVAWRLARDGRASARVVHVYAMGARGLGFLTLVGFGLIIHYWEWPRIVRSNLGLSRVVIAEHALILLPFLVLQIGYWWGLLAAERALRGRRSVGTGRYLTLRARQSLGLLLPVLLFLSVGEDLVARQWPEWSAGPWAEPVQAAVAAGLILLLSPLVVRLAWPTQSMPAGPLRDRLEHLARRLGFRYSDILVWDTGGGMVNACVTGSLPWFRYVLLTDSLIDSLEEPEIAAVFSHEIGHIAHRHLPYFGFFLAGSLGVLALIGQAIEPYQQTLADVFGSREHPLVVTALQSMSMLAPAALYFLVVFGYVSRRFEHQADVFGCQAVSCGQPDCPPHLELEHAPAASPPRPALCPIGIEIFANALIKVADLNGAEPGARSWRHGSIENRIAFLEALAGRPEALMRYHAWVRRLRVGLAVILVGAVVLALASGSVEHLR